MIVSRSATAPTKPSAFSIKSKPGTSLRLSRNPPPKLFQLLVQRPASGEGRPTGLTPLVRPSAIITGILLPSEEPCLAPQWALLFPSGGILSNL